jgi:hypothetical protein
VAQQTDDRSPALTPALGSMTLLVAAVIVHDKATNRVVLLQRSENAKFAQGMWDLPVGKSEPGEPITETAVRDEFGPPLTEADAMPDWLLRLFDE